MAAPELLSLLEDIRDRQQQQITNFERALATQQDAIASQRQARRMFWTMLLMPWALVLILGGQLLMAP